MSDTPDLRALHEAATTLRDRYVANRGSKHEFVVTMTDQGELRHQWQNLTNALDASGHPIPRERPLPEVEEALTAIADYYDDFSDCYILAPQAEILRAHIATLTHDLAVARETADDADLGYTCPSCGHWNYLHPKELTDADSVVECDNEDCSARVRIVVKLHATTEATRRLGEEAR